MQSPMGYTPPTHSLNVLIFMTHLTCVSIGEGRRKSRYGILVEQAQVLEATMRRFKRAVSAVF